MRPRVRFAAMALALGAACGRLASSSYQPPPVAVVRGTFGLPGTADPTGDPVRVHVVWQTATWTSSAADVLWQEDPLTSRPTPACGPPAASCGGSAPTRCTMQYGLAEAVAEVAYPGPGGSVDFEAPIFAVPPAAARRTLSAQEGGGTVALGYLLFATGDRVLASSAFNGAPLDYSLGYRKSHYLAYREGAAEPPAAANPGVLSRLPAGFSIVVKTEKESAGGILLPGALSLVPADTLLAVNGTGGASARRWCDAILFDQRWNPPPTGADWTGTFEPGDRCASTSASLTCVTWGLRQGCALDVARVALLAACLPPRGCAGAGPFEADAFAPPGHRSFQLLPSGDVVAFGGEQANEVTTAAIYDVSTRTWWNTGSLSFPRGPAPVVVLESGQVLVAGGSQDVDGARSVELYDPARGTWMRTASLFAPRCAGHTATRLPSGEVLVLGGTDASCPDPAWNAERFDPVHRTWSAFELGPGAPVLGGHAAVLVPAAATDWTVLVTSSTGPESWLCAPGGCRATAPMRTAHEDGVFTALGSTSGQVLATGGRTDPTSAEVFDVATETWTSVAPMSTGRVRHAAALLKDGRVLVAGGESATGTYLASAELFDPTRGAWDPAGILSHARSGLTLLPAHGSGALALGGGDGVSTSLQVEHYCPASASAAAAARPGAAAP